MDIAAIDGSALRAPLQASAPAATGPSPSDAVAAAQTLAQGRQIVAAQGISFARQSLQTAVAAANALSLIGGDGRGLLIQAQGAVAGAARQVRSLGGSAVAEAGQDPVAHAVATATANALGDVVGDMRILATALVTAPSTQPRADLAERGHRRAVAALQTTLDQMGGAVADTRAGVALGGVSLIA